MLHYVYIIYSESFDRFYIGETVDVEERVGQHNSGFYARSSTKFTSDWKLFLKIECKSRTIALQLEHFIKRMKNRKFYWHLKENPEIVSELIAQLK